MHLELATDRLVHGLVIEASAGTGKTYSVAALVTRELALQEDLRIGQILITTYTRNAAAELRDRVRRRLVQTVHALRTGLTDGTDGIVNRLRQGSVGEIAERIRRLERALVEYDSATITTIHGVCSRILRAAGMDAGSDIDEDPTERVVSEVVNDEVVAAALQGDYLDQGRIARVVKAMLGDPYLRLWVDPQKADGIGREEINDLRQLIERCLAKVKERMTASPSYNDILRIAGELVADPRREEWLASLRARFRLAIVDEAQDTDRQQWEFFNRLFPGTESQSLVSVGDPKQSIYSFRGADVEAYLHHASAAREDTAGGDGERRTTNERYRTLTTNRRSDEPLLDRLNQLFAGQEFGRGIRYVGVSADPKRVESRLEGIDSCVELYKLPAGDNEVALISPVVGNVIKLLEHGRLRHPQPGGGSEIRMIRPRDICVLVKTGNLGRQIERALLEKRIPAVTGGTASVMEGEVAGDFRTILEALEQPWNSGRVRRAAATLFFGHSLDSTGDLPDTVLESIQDRLMEFKGVLQKKGLAGLGALIEADETIMCKVAAGEYGERNITDLLHLIELLVYQIEGGCSPTEAIVAIARLEQVDPKSETVSRRIESDADAVRIMTIHAAKGLQFPCVIVASLWKGVEENRGRSAAPAVFYNEGERWIDLGFILGKDFLSAAAREYSDRAANEEIRRQLYVAVTRPENYLSVMVASGAKPSILQQSMNIPGELLDPLELPMTLQRELLNGNLNPDELNLAPAPRVLRTFRRMSFSGMTAGKGHVTAGPFSPEGGGFDESEQAVPMEPSTEDEGTEGVWDVIDLPAGVSVGTVVHEIFEHVDTSASLLREEVQRVVGERVLSGRLQNYRENLAEVVEQALLTPWGGPFGDLKLADIRPADRLCEMNFEMGLASLAEGLRANSIGKLLLEQLPINDPLIFYAELLSGKEFDVPVGGLLTGSMDAVLRLPGSAVERPELVICDYKSNRLHQRGSVRPLQAYAPDRLAYAMASHHYPLQALLYGTAVYRMLRWRLGTDSHPEKCLRGIVYAFIRGTQGPATPSDLMGRRYGVFVWQPPESIWGQLSDLLVSSPRGELEMPNREDIQNYIRAGVVSANDLAAVKVLVNLANGSQQVDPSLWAWLAMCLALKTVRDGHTCIDLQRIADWVPEDQPEGEVEQQLDWPPDAEIWLNALKESPALVGRPGERKPFILDSTGGGNRLYLARSLAEEEAIARAVRDRCENKMINVLLGGPGTGKTTTVARNLVERLRSVDENTRPPRLALAAPTGKAASRMVEVLRDRCAKANAPPRVLQLIDSSPALTVDKLLGSHPGKDQRFNYHAGNQLPYDLVIVDEVSMLSSSLMYHLLTALQPNTELCLVGDPDQLASVDAGTVLADIADFKPDSAGRVRQPFWADRIQELKINYRAESPAILELAAANRSGDAQATVEILNSGEPSVTWVDPNNRERLKESRHLVAEHAAAVRKRAVENPSEILEFRNQLQVLCAHRNGEMGVAGWNARIEKDIRVSSRDNWYLGRPVMVTRNNPSLGLSNGDVGVVIANGEQRRVAFGSNLSQPVSRLEEVATVHALTIHKSQGSEYDEVIVVLPERPSRILTRELLYTGVTRARKKVTVIGSEAVIRAAVERPIRRATGLVQRLS